MRHNKNTCKLNRTTSHRRCLFANMLKALITNGRIETTVAKAKALRRHADRMVTLAKRNTLASRRKAISEMMVRFNPLTEKEARQARHGEKSAFNDDRLVIDLLFTDLGKRFATRPGGYTRIIRNRNRIGDNAQMCIIEYLAE
jgi:large subunit ribosomal protein L17